MSTAYKALFFCVWNGRGDAGYDYFVDNAWCLTPKNKQRFYNSTPLITPHHPGLIYMTVQR